MATKGVPLWDTTASNNSSADPAVNWAEGQAPSTVNNSARGMMASVAEWRDDLYGRTTSGSSTAYTVTTGATFASASAMSGAVFCIIPHTTSGASPTLAVDGLTARAINISTGVAVPTGALVEDTPYLVKYVHASTEFILLGTLGKALLAALDIIGGTSETAIAVDDTIPLYDLSNTANRRMLVSDFLKVVNALTEDTTPDSAADFVMSYDGSASAAKKVKLSNIPSNRPRGYIDGCIISNGSDATNDINISAGVCRDSTDAVDIVIPAITGKQLDANWAAGGSAGMRNSAAGIANTVYHIWGARTAASSAGDIYAHTSASAATVLTALQAETGGSSYAYLRRIASIIRSGDTILAFTQVGDDFMLTTPAEDLNRTTDHTTAQTLALTVPTGVRVMAKVRVVVNGTGGNQGVLLTALDQTDSTPSETASPGMTAIVPTSGNRAAGSDAVWTNTSGQIRYRANNANVDTIIVTHGWSDLRGKDA